MKRLFYLALAVMAVCVANIKASESDLNKAAGAVSSNEVVDDKALLKVPDQSVLLGIATELGLNCFAEVTGICATLANKTWKPSLLDVEIKFAVFDFQQSKKKSMSKPLLDELIALTMKSAKLFQQKLIKASTLISEDKKKDSE